MRHIKNIYPVRITETEIHKHSLNLRGRTEEPQIWDVVEEDSEYFYVYPHRKTRGLLRISKVISSSFLPHNP